MKFRFCKTLLASISERRVDPPPCKVNQIGSDEKIANRDIQIDVGFEAELSQDHVQPNYSNWFRWNFAWIGDSKMKQEKEIPFI